MGVTVHWRQTERTAKAMKLMKSSGWVAALAWFAASVALAQTNPVTTATEPTREGSVIVVERPTANDANIGNVSNDRPPRTERPNLPPEVTVRLESFKTEARNYLAQQEALKKQLRGANDEERAVLRDKLKALREQWLEQSRELRKDYKERQQELAEKLTDYRKLLNDVRATALEESKNRTRRGED